MLALRNILRSSPQLAKNVVQLRNMSAISTPARNKVSRAEQIALASMMVVGWCFIPGWVLVNIKKYRAHE